MTKKEIWMLQTKRADFQGLSQALKVSPVAVRIMRNRGLETEEDMRDYWEKMKQRKGYKG